MCERCDAMDALGAQVDEAVAAEALPQVCSNPECEGVPVVRLSANPDRSELLCPMCLAGFAALSAVREVASALREAHVVLPESSQDAVAGFVSHQLSHLVEVL